MKIVLTLNELKASHELFKKVGVATDDLVKLMAKTKEGEIVTQKEIIRTLDVSDEAIAKMNKHKNIMTVVKHMDGNGTTCFTIIISEEFICDINGVHGDLIVEVINQIKVAYVALKSFFDSRLKSFVAKWNL